MSPQQLASDQIVKPAAGGEVGRMQKPAKSGSKWLPIALVLVLLAAAGSGGAFLLASGRGQGDAKHAALKHNESFGNCSRDYDEHR